MVFIEGVYIASSGGFITIAVAVAMSVWRAREAKTAATYGSARWATLTEIRAAGLTAPDGVVLGRFARDYLRHDGPEHMWCFAPTRSGKGVGLVVPTLLTWPGSCIVHDIKAGAQDFLTKPVSSDQLLGAIERALANHQTVRDQRGKLDILRALTASLTPRERQVFELVVRGKINKQIAAQLGTTERTIKAHRHKVMEKMKVQTLVELVSTADRLGMFEITDKNRG